MGAAARHDGRIRRAGGEVNGSRFAVDLPYPRLTAATISGMSEGKRKWRLLIGAMVAVPLAFGSFFLAHAIRQNSRESWFLAVTNILLAISVPIVYRQRL